MDYPLSEMGRAQAVATARWFSDRGLEGVLTSPLARAKETADIVAEAVGLTALVSEDLTELDIGDFSGMGFEEMRRSDPSEFRSFQQRSWEGVSSAEKISSLETRALATWNRLFQLVTTGRRSLLAVTHSGILNWIVRVSFGYRQWMPLFPMANCGIYHFQISNGVVEADEADALQTPRYLAVWRLLNFVADGVE
jgi:broad specificity phosphatase PhoE